jgi:YesN/AraC family two-component response regulator
MISEKIVVVDDDARIVESLNQVLLEYELVVFNDGESALKYLTRPNEINLVILDVYMKGLNGLEVLERIKQIKKDISVIMMTGHGTQDIMLEALRGHADDFIEKPFDVTDLRERVKKVLKEKSCSDVYARDRASQAKRIQKFIERNYTDASLTHIANEMCLSPQYVGRIFSKEGGGSFRGYKLKVKMKRAQDLLKMSSMNVSEIAYDLGYKNPESFMRAFKNYFDYTPSDFREQAKEGLIPHKMKNKGNPP